ncbi:MAG: nucleotide pyrophosphohydrolase [Pseudomonadales bacterium]|nr:nucleotide pyrophosphohydrolase [Pseudomonadales bacterium]
MDSLQDLKQELQKFAAVRQWDQFHSPKNLVMALSGEVGELTEHFQWLSEDQSSSLDDKTHTAVAEEIADVQIYLIRLADKLDIDIIQAAKGKILSNAVKYPIEKFKGSAKKYTDNKEPSIP